MPVLYEHWRPDLNECFYVGVSWARETTRPYDLTPRNPHHGNVVNKIQKNGFQVDIRIQAEIDWITKKELGELEKLQIKYWRNLIGERLTNISSGGDGVTDWTDELRLQHSEILTNFFTTPEGIAQRKTHSERMSKIMEDENLRFHLRKKGIEQFISSESRINASIRMQDFFQSEEGQEARQQMSIVRQNFLDSPEGESWRLNQSIRTKNYLSLPEVKEARSKIMQESHSKQEFKQAQSKRITDFYQTNKGKERILCIAKIAESVAQDILNYSGSHAKCARHFNVSYGIVYNIRKRKTWRHLNPNNKEK